MTFPSANQGLAFGCHNPSAAAAYGDGGQTGRRQQQVSPSTLAELTPGTVLPALACQDKVKRLNVLPFERWSNRADCSHAYTGGDGLLKIATFNVSGVNGRLPVLLRLLVEARPDVVCLQELKAPQSKFPQAAIREAGYGAIWHGQQSWNGVAILARGQDHT